MLIEVSSVVIACAVVGGAVAGFIGWRRVRRIDERTQRIEADVQELKGRKGPACMLDTITKE